MKVQFYDSQFNCPCPRKEFVSLQDLAVGICWKLIDSVIVQRAYTQSKRAIAIVGASSNLNKTVTIARGSISFKLIQVR